jgi:hypothetical protein
MSNKAILSTLAALALVVLVGCASPAPAPEWPIRRDPLSSATKHRSAQAGSASGQVLHTHGTSFPVATANRGPINPGAVTFPL